MTNIIVAADDASEDIGNNCRLSYEHLGRQVDLQQTNLRLLNGHECDAYNVESSITSFDGEPFIFVAYSHGRVNALVSTIAHDGYVNVNNAYFFGNSLIYTNSCYSALELKQHLVDSSCYGYVGYTGEVAIPRNEEDQKIFISCENMGLIHFLNSDDTLTESVGRMKEEYLRYYNEYLDNGMEVVGGLLRDNLYLLDFHDCISLRRTIFT